VNFNARLAETRPSVLRFLDCKSQNLPLFTVKIFLVGGIKKYELARTIFIHG